MRAVRSGDEDEEIGDEPRPVELTRQIVQELSNFKPGDIFMKFSFTIYWINMVEN